MKLNQEQMQFLKSLIAIRSVSGTPEETDGRPGTPYGSAPRAALSFFLDNASKSGFSTGVLDNRVGWCEIGEGEKLIGIICHLDVVPAGEGWDTDPFTLTEKDGLLIGRGVVDDKGPAAASFFAMQSILEDGIPEGYRIRLILGTDEERTCSCVEYYDQNGEIPDIAITPDAEFPAIYAEKGILHVKISDERPLQTNISITSGNAANMVAPSATVTSGNGTELFTVRGRTAHASRPELGINAIDILPSALKDNGLDAEIPLVTFVSNYDKDSLTDTEDESGSLTSNHGILSINGSEQYLITDIRYPVTASFDDIIANMKKQADRYGLKVEIDSHMPPLYKPKDSDVIKKLTTIWNRHMSGFDGFKEEYRGIYSQPGTMGGGTYARHIRNTVAFGPRAPWSEDMCHQANERMSLRDFEELVDTIKDAVLELGKPEA